MSTIRTHIDHNTPLGATLLPDGVAFRTWAPQAQQVFVLTGPALTAARQAGVVPAADDALFTLGDGTWGGFVPGATEGTPYLFWIVGTGSTGLKRDPRAHELTPGFPDSDCLVRSPTTYPWHDTGFRTPAFNDLIMYQLHAGVFYGVDAAGRDKRRAIAKFLDILYRVEYFRTLGINAIQLLPIQEFPTETSRGYNGLDLFSPEMTIRSSSRRSCNATWRRPIPCSRRRATRRSRPASSNPVPISSSV
jgi:1,4-alpha-glucan branching enzyme